MKIYPKDNLKEELNTSLKKHLIFIPRFSGTGIFADGAGTHC